MQPCLLAKHHSYIPGYVQLESKHFRNEDLKDFMWDYYVYGRGFEIWGLKGYQHRSAKSSNCHWCTSDHQILQANGENIQKSAYGSPKILCEDNSNALCADECYNENKDFQNINTKYDGKSCDQRSDGNAIFMSVEIKEHLDDHYSYEIRSGYNYYNYEN